MTAFVLSVWDYFFAHRDIVPTWREIHKLPVIRRTK